MERRIRIDRTERLISCEPKNAAVTWPVPLDALLDQLVRVVEDAGERTTRRELAAAVLLACPRDPSRLAKLLRAYRTATVSDVVPSGEVGTSIVEFRTAKPGPRRRHQASG